MINKKFVLCLLLFTIVNNSFGQVSEGTPCETPDQQYGLCVNIKSCGVLINLLRTQSDNPQVRTYLRSSTCGFIGNTPMVCCPQPATKNTGSIGIGNANNVPDDSNNSNNNNNNNFENTNSNENNNNNINNESGKFLQTPNCGKANSSFPRIVGGNPASLGQFPWIVALGYRNQNNPNQPKWLCGGSLITSRHILTAGHCVHNRIDLYVARVGDLDLYSDTDGAHPETIPLVFTKVHEDYSPVKFTNDIAIVTMERASTNPAVSPICLPITDKLRTKDYIGTQPIVAGWGAIYFNGPSSSILRMVLLPVHDNQLCQRAFGNKTIIDNRIICAGILTGGKDACQGDSGGPLMITEVQNQQFSFYQIGVVSYGFRCAEAGYPGVYTRVTSFIDWIQRNI